MRRLSKRLTDLAVYGLGTIANSALGFVLLPVYMKKFTPSEYGVINLFLLVISFASMFVSAGMMSSLQRLYFLSEGDERRKLLGSTTLWYLAAVAALACVVVPLQVNISFLLFKTADYGLELILVLAIVALTLILDVPLNVLRLERRAAPYVVFSLLRLISELGLKILFIVFLGKGIRGYFVSSVISLLLVNLAIFVYSGKDYSISFSWTQLRRMLKLGIPFIFTGLSIWSLNAMDRLQLNFMIGTSATGIYSAGLRFSQIFNIVFYKPLSLFLPPLMLSSSNDEERTWGRFPRLLNALTLFGSLVAALAAVASVEGVRLITQYLGTHREYLDAIPIVPVLTFSSLLYALTIPVGYLALRIEKTTALAYTGAIAAGANVILNYILIRLLGVAGASWATFLAYLIYVVTSYLWLRREKALSFAYLRNALQFGITFALVHVLSMVRLDPLVLGLLAKMVLVTAVILLSGWKLTKVLDNQAMRSINAFVGRAAR